MKVYWDTSAIIWYFGRGRIGEIRGVTRPHTLSETFSALTGGGFELVMPDGTKKHRRLSLRAASVVVSRFHPQLEYIELSANGQQLASRSDARGPRVGEGRIPVRASLRDAAAWSAQLPWAKATRLPSKHRYAVADSRGRKNSVSHPAPTGPRKCY
jgi:hypothetical protein